MRVLEVARPRIRDGRDHRKALPGKGFRPWAWTGSNRRPLPCKGSALPTELNARGGHGNAGRGQTARGSVRRVPDCTVRGVLVRCIHPVPSTVTLVLSQPPADRAW